MKLTTKTTYGVRALVTLADSYDLALPVTIKSISIEEGISSTYLEQIFSCLKKKGIIISVRGPSGGYMLAKSPEIITVYDIVEALEDNLLPVRCAEIYEENVDCKRSGHCSSREVWWELAREIEKTLRKFSLKDLTKKESQEKWIRESIHESVS